MEPMYDWKYSVLDIAGNRYEGSKAFPESFDHIRIQNEVRGLLGMASAKEHKEMILERGQRV